MVLRLTLLILFIPLICVCQRKDAYDYYDLGEAAHDEGNAKEAIEFLNACIRLNPRYSRAYFMRASAKEQLNDLHGALTDYSIYLDMKPDHTEALLSRAQVRYRLGLYQQAREDYLLLLELPPGETTTVFFNQTPSADNNNMIKTMQNDDKSYLYNYLGLTAYKLKNYNKAIYYFDTAIYIQGKQSDYYVNRGLVKEALHDSTARFDYELALKINPNQVAAMSNLASLKSRQGDVMSANEQLDQAIESDSSISFLYLQRATQKFEKEDFKGALIDYNKALQNDTTNSEVWLGRGLIKERLLDLEGAYADYTHALNMNERYEKAWINRANILAKLGQYEKAIEDYSVVILFNENNAAAYYNRAMAEYNLKKFIASCDDLTKAEALGMKVEAKIKNEICPVR